MKDSKLIPCPKCGGTMKIKLWNDGYQGQLYQAECAKCGLSSGIADYETIVHEWAAHDKHRDALATYICSVDAKEKMKKTRGKKIYVCAPYRGTLEEMLHNRKLTIDRCRALYEQGSHPIAPQLYYPLFLDEDNPQDRQFGLDAGLDWLKVCDEIYVYGSRTTAGMLREIDFALDHGIPARYVPE